MQDYTRIPNFLFDEKLNPYQRDVAFFIARKTIGWGKQADGISLSQFLNHLQIKKTKLIETLKELAELELIIITKQKDDTGRKSFNLYQIKGQNIDVRETDSIVRETDSIVRETENDSSCDGHTIVRVTDIHKETNTKETNTKVKENKKKSEIVKNYSQYFEDWWIFYKQNTIKVNIDSKKKAFDYYKKALNTHTPEQLATSLKDYMAYCKHNKIWTKSAYQYLKNKCYENDYKIKLTEEDVIKQENDEIDELYRKIKEEENESNSN